MTPDATAEGGAAAAFVDASIEEAERAAERSAQRGDEGLEEETRMLRTLVQDRLRNGKDDACYEAALKGMRVLLQAIKVRYVISAAAAAELGDQIERVVRAIKGQAEEVEEDV
jgi:hypothetical protein